jgi:hypothetical protein
MWKQAALSLTLGSIAVVLPACSTSSPTATASGSGPSTSRSVATTTSTTTPASTTTSQPPFSTTTTTALAAGVFSDSFHFHKTTMDISPNGQGTASWEGTTPATGDQGTFHLTAVEGRTATGIVDTSTDPTRWPPGETFTLTLESNDMLVVTPGGPFAPMCGSQANQESEAGNPPAGVNCGA